MGADRLRMRNMRFFARHGLFPAENELGQHFEVDLELHLDLSRAGRSDNPAHTIDYPKVYALVEEVVLQRQFKLVEALAQHIADTVGKSFAPLNLTVRVRKPHPPLPAHFDGIEVELHRLLWLSWSLSGWAQTWATPLANVQSAINALANAAPIRVIAVSSAYTSAPVGYLDQPHFTNAAAALKTLLPPRDLLAFLLDIEAAHHRRRRIHWGPRTLDLDILLYGERRLDDQNLTVPHAHLTKRRFVLTPLCEIAPALCHPRTNRPLADYLDRCTDTSPLPPIAPLHLPSKPK